jgi:hypothetical protein
MVILRLDIVAAGEIDWAICSLPDLRLERRDGGTFLECGADVAGMAQRLLARAGARVVTVDALPPRAASLLPARVCDLAPFDIAGTIDSLTVRALAVGEAARVTRRGFFGRRPPDDARLRDVLRGGDRMFAWRRIVWAERATLRTRALGNVRPIVFDSTAITHGQERRAYVRDGALARWIGR